MLIRTKDMYLKQRNIKCRENLYAYENGDISKRVREYSINSESIAKEIISYNKVINSSLDSVEGYSIRVYDIGYTLDTCGHSKDEPKFENIFIRCSVPKEKRIIYISNDDVSVKISFGDIGVSLSVKLKLGVFLNNYISKGSESFNDFNDVSILIRGDVKVRLVNSLLCTSKSHSFEIYDLTFDYLGGIDISVSLMRELYDENGNLAKSILFKDGIVYSTSNDIDGVTRTKSYSQSDVSSVIKEVRDSNGRLVSSESDMTSIKIKYDSNIY